MKQVVLILVRQDVRKVVMTCNMHVVDNNSIQHFTCKTQREENIWDSYTQMGG